MSDVRFNVTPLTPIHIGSGESLEPFEYVIVGDQLSRFTLDDFMLALPAEQQAAFVEMVARSVPATRDFVAGQAQTALEVARWRAGVSSAARDLYAGRLAGGEAHPEVFANIRSNDRLYLPGSSLKGALRTALLYQAMDRPHSGQDAHSLEQETFGFRRVQEDPFRAFKLSDGQVLEIDSWVRAVAVNTRRGGRWEEDVAVLVETLPGLLSDNVQVTSVHTARLDEDFYRLHARAFQLTPGRILAACREFYGAHLAAEAKYTADLPETAAVYRALVAHAQNLPEHACLVRLAWGSGRDATTVSYGLADGESPNSRRLTEDGFPLGWAELRITDGDGQPVAVEKSMAAVAEAPPRAAPTRAGRPRSLRDLQAGMVLNGQVTRTVEYGAFVDVGVGRDGLIHISQLAKGFVQRVEDVVRRGDQVEVEVLKVDQAQGRISLRLVGKL